MMNNSTGKKKPGGAPKLQDHYALLGLSHLRYLATKDQIRESYSEAALRHHPDKQFALLLLEETEDAKHVKRDEIARLFTPIQEPYEVLIDHARRRLYDSTDEFADAILVEYAPQDFFKVFGPAFLRHGRWSVNPDVPTRGDDQPPIKEVKSDDSIARGYLGDGMLRGSVLVYNAKWRDYIKPSSFTFAALLHMSASESNAEARFPIQAMAFGIILDGSELLGSARTSHGKNFVLVLTTVEALLNGPAKSTKQTGYSRANGILVLLPTREMDTHVADAFEISCRWLNYCCTYGGAPTAPQNQLERGNIVVRLLQLGVPDVVDGNPLDTPAHTTDSHVVLVHGIPHEQWLVQWSLAMSAPPTWESTRRLRANFPHLHLEDKVLLIGGRDDTDLAPASSDNDDQAHAATDPGPQANKPSSVVTPNMAATRPIRKRSQPSKFRDYVSH